MKANLFFCSIGLVSLYFLTFVSVKAQNDSMYILKSGVITGQFKLSEIDSIIFYRPGSGASFQCGDLLEVSHLAGLVAPVDKTTTYGTITNIPGEVNKCWITSNLGSDRQAVSLDDGSEQAAGWYWQFNSKQGYKHTGSLRIPNTPWISSITGNSDWLTENDPCNLELGFPWRIPTYTEWYNVDNAGGWNNFYGPWESNLKLHCAGNLRNNDAFLLGRGFFGFGSYWSNMQESLEYGWPLYFDIDPQFVGGVSGLFRTLKATASPLRCLREN